MSKIGDNGKSRKNVASKSEYKPKLVPRPSCATCISSSQWITELANNVVAFHPLYACLHEESSHFGIWLSDVFACDLFIPDEKKVEFARKRKEHKIVVPPKSIFRQKKRFI